MMRVDGWPWERFWAKVDKTGECWMWLGGASDDGYGHGRFWFENKLVAAHRFSYELANGAVEAGKMVLHRCDNPKCVRPDHLFLGTAQDNSQDMVRKGRSNRGKQSRRLTPVEREKIIEMVRKDIPAREIASSLGIGIKSVIKWAKRGNTKQAPHPTSCTCATCIPWKRRAGYVSQKDSKP